MTSLLNLATLEVCRNCDSFKLTFKNSEGPDMGYCNLPTSNHFHHQITSEHPVCWRWFVENAVEEDEKEEDLWNLLGNEDVPVG